MAAAELGRVLLVGGSTRIPLVRQLLRERLAGTGVAVVRAIGLVAPRAVMNGLADVFTWLVKRLDREALRQGARGSTGPLPEGLEEAFYELVEEEDVSVDEAIDELTADVPPGVAGTLEPRLRALWALGEPRPSPASRELWLELGEALVSHEPQLLRSAIDYVAPADATRLLALGLDGLETLAEHVELSHEICPVGSELRDWLVERIGVRFGDTRDTWARAYESQRGCYCQFTHAIVERFLLVAARDGGRPDALVRNARRLYPTVARRVDALVRPAKPARRAKAPAAKAKAPAAKAKAPAAKAEAPAAKAKAPAAKAEAPVKAAAAKRASGGGAT